MRLPPFYPIVDSALLEKRPMTCEAAAGALLAGGAKILQFRHKSQWTRGTLETARRISALCHTAGALFVVNDRVDFAMILHAAVHVGQDDLSPQDARKLMGSQATIGFSTHNESQLREAAESDADYLALGPIFGTASKEKPSPTVGLEELRRLRPLTNKPVVAIGGITLDRATAVLEAGADSLAVIGDLFPVDAMCSDVQRRAQEWVRLVGGSKE
jgi:thiamine-phosphate pyrophosphorylase